MKKSLLLVAALASLLGPLNADATVLSWEALGGADDYPQGIRPALQFAPIAVGNLVSIVTEANFFANVGMQNSGERVWVFAEFDNAWQIIATTEIIGIPYHASITLDFPNIFPGSGNITRINWATTYNSGDATITHLNGTKFIFDDPVATIPEPETRVLLLTGLGLLGLIAKRRKSKHG